MHVTYAGRYADPITDFGFKRMFAGHATLIAFINAVLPVKDKVTAISYLHTEMIGDGVATRTVVYDLRCVTADGRTVIVEVQRLAQPYFKERTLYYAMRSFAEQVQPGDRFYELKPVYVIALVDYDLPGANGKGGYEGYFHQFRLSSAAGELFSDVLQLYFVELNKLPMPTDTLSADTTTLAPLEQWTLAMRNMKAMDKIPDWVTEEEVRKAFTTMEVANMSAQERDNWERALAQDRDVRGAVLQQYIYGKEEGREEGREEGLLAKAHEVAHGMAAKGMPRTLISELTGLSAAELDDLLGPEA